LGGTKAIQGARSSIAYGRYAKIIDEVNKLPLSDLQRPAPAPAAPATVPNPPVLAPVR
jgi:hypothetical protein